MNPIPPIIVVALVAGMATSPGMITPEHGFLYDLDIFFDNLVLFFSPDKEQTLINILNERMAEIQMSGGDVKAVVDYLSKLEELRRSSSDEIQTILMKNLDEHENIISNLKPTSKEAEVMVSHITDEIKNFKLDLQGKSREEIQQRFTSYISVPASVRVGEEVTISFRICNPLNTQVTPLVRIVAVKEGIPGDLIRHEETISPGKTIAPGSCYSDSVMAEIPSEYLGIPLKGSWRITVEVFSDSTTLFSKTYKILVN